MTAWAAFFRGFRVQCASRESGHISSCNPTVFPPSDRAGSPPKNTNLPSNISWLYQSSVELSLAVLWRSVRRPETPGSWRDGSGEYLIRKSCVVVVQQRVKSKNWPPWLPRAPALFRSATLSGVIESVMATIGPAGVRGFDTMRNATTACEENRPHAYH